MDGTDAAVLMPWVSRSAHQETVAILRDQIDDLRAERKLLLDRLGSIGLGGPIYNPVTVPVAYATEAPEEEEEEDLIDPEGDMLALLMQYKNRPSKLAAALTRMGRASQSGQSVQKQVAWLPQKSAAVTAALDSAEQAVLSAVKG